MSTLIRRDRPESEALRALLRACETPPGAIHRPPKAVLGPIGGQR